MILILFFFFFQAEDGIRDHCVTGVQTCALPISQRTSCRRLPSFPARSALCDTPCALVTPETPHTGGESPAHRAPALAVKGLLSPLDPALLLQLLLAAND